MSWWISLNDSEGEPLPVDKFTEGGTYALGGSDKADLNVTYNYGKHFDFEQLNGKTGKATQKLLDEAVEKLGTIRDHDYWNPTEGNVGRACSILAKWAHQYPKGVWRVN